MACLDIDLNDCQKIVSNVVEEPFEIINFKIAPYSENIIGYIGDHLRLKIETKYEETVKKLSFFTKKLKISCGVTEQLNHILNMYDKESYFYGTFLKEIEDKADVSFAPKYYYSKDSAVVLEDLKQYEVVDNFDFAHAKFALKMLAKLHTISFAREKFKKLPDDLSEYLQESVFRNEEDYWGKLFTQSCIKGVCALIDVAYKNDEFKTKFLEGVQEIFQTFNSANKYKNVLCHGDLWKRNILFKHNDKQEIVDCKLIDYQVYRYAPPAHDVTYLIYQTTDEITRQKHYHELLNYYYSELKTDLLKFDLNVEQIVSWDEYQETCVYYLKIAKYIKALFSTITIENDYCCALLRNNPEEYYNYLNRDASKIAIKLYLSDDKYQKNMHQLLESVKELIERPIITREDCYAILQKKLRTNNYKIQKIEAAAIVEVSGFLGDAYKLKIILDSGTAHDFFVKTMGVSEGQIEFCMDTGAVFKEHQYFYKIVPRLLKYGLNFILNCTPICYLTRLYSITVLEDLTLQGYALWDKRKCLIYQYVVNTLKSLAEFHASAYIFEEKLSKELGENYRIIDDYKIEFKEAFYTDKKAATNLANAIKKGFLTSIELFKDSHPEFSDEIFKERGLKYLTLKHFVYSSKKFRNTICHGDVWIANVMYNKSGHCKLLDHQSYRYVPPTNDVLAMIYLTTNRAFRTKYMAQVLDIYYNELKLILNESEIDINSIFPYEHFLESCQYEKQFAISQALSHSQVVYLTSDQMKTLFADPEVSKKAIFEDRSELITQTCIEDPAYKAKILETLIDLRELCQNEPYFI